MNHFYFAFLFLILWAVFSLLFTEVHAQSGRTFYIDCVAGNNSNNGTSQSTAWKNLAMFNNRTISGDPNEAPDFNLGPGDTVYLKKGCIFTRYNIVADWNGTSTSPITFDAYGSGELPIIKDIYLNLESEGSNVAIVSGSHIVFQNLHISLTHENLDSKYVFTYVDTVNDGFDTNCPITSRQIVGYWRGILLKKSARNIVIKNNKFTNLASGVHFEPISLSDIPNIQTNNQILYNVFENNSAVTLNINPSDGKTEFVGAGGIFVKGHDTTIAYNTFRNNISKCKSPRDGKWESNSVELFNAKRTLIHHNTSNDRVFSEAGSDLLYDGVENEVTTSDNVWAYNEINSSIERARFLTLHVASATNAPVNRSRVFNNRVYHTGNDSQGVVCGGCTPTDLIFKNNIIWTVEKAIYVNVGRDFNESHNIYYDGDNTHSSHFFQNFSIDPTSRYINPLFVNVGANNFKLSQNSPAIDTGTSASLALSFNSIDNYGISVPQNGVVDIGTHEYTIAISTIPTPTLSPTRTPTPTSLPTPTPPQTVVSFTLVNADTDQDIMQLVDGATIDFVMLGTKNLNVRANTQPGTVGSVRFELDGSGNYRIENSFPYAFAGDMASTDYLPWTPFPGSHTLTAVPYSAFNATGVAGTPLTITFSVVRILGDADGNNKVDVFDYNILITNFGRIGVTGGASEGDFEPDGDVDIFDYNVLLSNLGSV